jgi:hypothetical protein
MKIVNYDREAVARQLDTLKTSIATENKNIIERDRAAAKSYFIAVSILNGLALMASILLMCINMVRIGVIITAAFILAVMLGSAALILLTIFKKSIPMSTSERKTFAMKFYEIEQMGQIIAIEQTGKCVKVLFKDKEDYVEDICLCPYKVVKNTSITEPQLDITRGYLIVPYIQEETVKYEESPPAYTLPNPDSLS